jgi:hypothetical protein
LTHRSRSAGDRAAMERGNWEGVRALAGHALQVSSVAFAPNGKTLLSRIQITRVYDEFAADRTPPRMGFEFPTVCLTSRAAAPRDIGEGSVTP